MDLKQYFEKTRGMGVLSTAGEDGKVNAAVYARPHVLEDGSLAFIMRDRLTHHNLQSNSRAAYLFREDGGGYKGLRLHLTKTLEESGTDRVKDLCRRCKIDNKPDAVRFLVVFKIDQELPLIGAGNSPDYPVETG
ncbi:MAG: hypothetical protein [Olavius algarvensis Delta 4 endosymbiont]|nr:MAG: hypothetical protein [Olavius algarvensis Delta 4 endosymbiont]